MFGLYFFYMILPYNDNTDNHVRFLFGGTVRIFGWEPSVRGFMHQSARFLGLRCHMWTGCDFVADINDHPQQCHSV